MHVHIYKHVHIFVHVCLHMHVWVHTLLYACIYVPLHACLCTHTCQNVCLPPPIGSSSQENPNRYTSLHFHCLCFQTFLLRIPEEAFFFKTITSGVSFSKCKLDVGKLNLHDPFTEPKIKLLEVPLPLSLCRDSFLCMTLYINCPSCVIGSSVSSSLPDSILPPPTH